MLGNIKNTKALLDKYNLQPKKKFGQNFLVDENVLRKIVDAAGPDANTGVVEIGPGIGALTELLLQNFRKVLAFEIDKGLVEVLKEELGDYQNFKLVDRDFLKVDLEEELKFLGDCERIIVVSNLPYYITTQIIVRLLEAENRIEEFYFMVQKEVGERMVAEEGGKEYGALSLLIRYRCESAILFPVSRNSFLPKPNVDSVIIKLKKRKLDLGVKDEGRFLEFLRNAFSQRRKTLANNLLANYKLTKEKITDSFKELEIPENIRSEALSLERLAGLYRKIFEST